MWAIIKNMVTYFEKKIGVSYRAATDSSPDVIVSGYSYPLKKYQQEFSEGGDHRQVGILYADIAEYSRLTGLADEATHHRLVENMEIMKAYVFANNGRVVHFTGDAILAEFNDADNALNCAINMQMANRQYNAGLRSDRQALFRIGVNFSDVAAGHDDTFGNAINLAARLEKLAHSGGICVSESVRHRLKNHPSFKFVATGNQYLKNISDPVQAFWIESRADRIEEIDHACEASSSYRDSYV